MKNKSDPISSYLDSMIKKIVFIILALVVSVYLFSYAKEEQHTTTAPKVPTKTEDVQNEGMLKLVEIE